jgi:hypothetical protein
MADRKVAIRFGTEGKAQIVADLGEIGTSGDAAFNRVAKSAARAGQEAEAAVARANRQAEKLAALMPGLNPGKLDMYAGITEGTRKSAESSAAIFGAAFEQMERRADALRAAIDPVFAAQQRFNREIGEARGLVNAGALSLDDYVAKLRHEQAALDAVADQHQRVSQKSGAMGQAMAGASYQLQDFFTQVSMGQNPVLAFIVQGGQLAGQFQNIENRAGAVARFFMTGWGLGLQIAVLALAPFVSKLWEESEAEKAAREAADEHRKAVLDLADAQGTAIRTAERKQAIDVANIKIMLDAAIATRQQTQALLEQAVAQERIDRQRASAPGQRGENASLSAAVSSDRAAGLEALLTKNQGDLDRLQKGFDLGVARLVGMKVDARSTPTGIVNAQYERARADAMEKYAGNEQRLSARLRELIAIRDKEIERIQKAEAAQRSLNKSVNEYGREVTSAQASTIARAAGLTVNSADRSVERQRQLYNAWVAAGKPSDNPVAKPGSSAHNRGNALDIQMSAGVTVAKIRSAFEAEGVRLTKIITERGHWHIEWARTAAQKQADKDMAKDVRDAAAAHRELQSDVDGLIKLLDPARAAGDAYAQTLLTIAKAEQAGMLTQGEALGYRLTAAQQERDRRGKELVQASTAMFGGDDPLKDLLDRGQREKEQQVDLWNTNRERGMESYRSVADFYLNAMNGGTRSIWDLFRQNGLRVLSELLAKWTVGQSGGGGGILKLLGLAGSASGGTSAEALRMAQYDVPAGIQMPPGFATGTEYASGGWAKVGEFGQELVRLPRGSKVVNAAATRRMMAGNDNGRGDTHVHVYAQDAVLAETVRGWVAEGVEVASVRGAAGGSAMGQAEQRATGARRLGRRW